MDTNAVIVVLAEPFGLDDRRDISEEIVLQEARQKIFARATTGVLPLAALPAIGLNWRIKDGGSYLAAQRPAQ
jgi:hypothetical protein